MKLERLSLANCGAFEQIDIDFESDVTVIAGVNGVGKSTLLRALAVVLSRALPEFTPSRSAAIYFEDDEIHANKNSLEVSVRLQIDGQTLDAGIQRLRNAEEKGDRFILFRKPDAVNGTIDRIESLRSRTLTGDLEAGIQETRAALTRLKNSTNPPLAVLFTTKRFFQSQPRTLPEAKPFDPSIAYGRALHDRDVELREFMHWFRTQEKLGSENEPRRLRVLEALRDVVTVFVPEFSNLRIQETPRLGFIVDKGDEPLYIHQLSDGERGLLALILDLTRRLAIANPDSDDPIAEGTALVLIDEIELHLHPKWQRYVLRRLRDTFKNCQFIITTHSPQVIGQVRAEKLRLLSHEETGKVILVPVDQAFGMDSGWVLENIMGVPARDYETEQKLSKIFDYIDEGDLIPARDLISVMREDIGDFPDLQEASALLDRLDLLRDE